MSQATAVPPLVELLQYLVSQVVSDPESIQISRVETPKTDLFYLKVSQDDLGRLLGREGKTVESIRVMLDVAAAQLGKGAIVDVIEPKHGKSSTSKAEAPAKKSRRRNRKGRRSRSGSGPNLLSSSAARIKSLSHLLNPRHQKIRTKQIRPTSPKSRPQPQQKSKPQQEPQPESK